jgi:hypothetical protein
VLLKLDQIAKTRSAADCRRIQQVGDGQIPVVQVVGDELPEPQQIASSGVEHNHRGGVEVLPHPHTAEEIRHGVADGDIEQAFFHIQRWRYSDPARHRGVRPPCFPMSRNRVHPPRGRYLNRHTGSPSDSRKAPIQPLMPYSLIPIPEMTRSS